jgi:serine/threonine protein kinase
MKTCPQCDTGYPDSQSACPIHGHMLNEIRELKPGMVIHKTYRIVRKLGQGGMGTVYLAQHIHMGESRALKFLSPELSRDQAFTGRFLREVRTLRQIRNNNVVDCGDLEAAEDDSLFFSMEFVDGPDLRTFLNDACLHTAEIGVALKGHDFSRAANDPKEAPALAAEGSFSSTSPKSPNFPAAPACALPVPLALSIARQIAEGLGAAHSKGMVHRDIKPDNILMARDAAAWLPKIADFGIVATKESSTAYTRTGGTLLTMAYAAPEQWRGTAAAELDGRTDLYALGGLLYEMLTGQTPFHAESYEGWSRQHQTTPPQPPSTLRPDLANWQGLDALVLRLLAKDRHDRPEDVAELINLLDAVQPANSTSHQETVSENNGHNLFWISAFLQRKWPKSVVIMMGILFAAFAILGIVAEINYIGWAFFGVALVLSLTIVAIWGRFGFRRKWIVAGSIFLGVIALISILVCILNFYFYIGAYSGNLNQRGSLGMAYFNGDDEFQKDRARGEHLLQESCDEGDSQSCIFLGFAYQYGRYVEKDYAKAEAFFIKAYSGNEDYPKSETLMDYRSLAFDYSGVDMGHAVSMFNKACDWGDELSCVQLGYLYENGTDVPQDLEKAKQIFSKSCSMGYQWTCYKY